MEVLRTCGIILEVDLQILGTVWPQICIELHSCINSTCVGQAISCSTFCPATGRSGSGVVKCRRIGKHGSKNKEWGAMWRWLPEA